MDAATLDELEKTVRGFLADTSTQLSWEWDGRFYGGLTQFERAQIEGVSRSLAAHLGEPWTVDTIDNASELVLIISDVVGGLRPGQRLYVSDSEKSPLVFGAYWPWGDGDTVSLRLVPTGQGLSGDEMVALVKRFREWCNI